LKVIEGEGAKVQERKAKNKIADSFKKKIHEPE